MQELEEELAALIEVISERDLGIHLGSRTRRDGRDASGLTVDFTYESGHAVEITTTPDPDLEPHAAAVKLADRLSAVATGWLIVVDSAARMRNLESEFLSLIERGSGFRPNDYTSEDINRWLEERRLVEETDWRNRLEAIGIVALERRPDIEGVRALVMGPMRTFEGTSTRLLEAVEANARKLAACRPRRTHLVVGITAFGITRDPTATEVPRLPDAIDDVWVVHRWRMTGQQAMVWHARRGDSTWSLHEEPDPPAA